MRLPTPRLTMIGSHLSALSRIPLMEQIQRVPHVDSQVTILALQQIFSRFGKVNKIVMFDKGSGFQALVQMNDVYTAMNAHEAADMQVHCARPPSNKHDKKPLRKVQEKIVTFHNYSACFLRTDISSAQDHRLRSCCFIAYTYTVL